MRLPRVVKDWLFALGLALLVYGVVSRLTAGPPDLPETAPAFALRDLDGEALELQALSGQVVVLNFWASWCGPCKAEAPAFARFARDNPDVVVLGLAVDSGDEDAVREASRKLGMDYRVAVADRATISAYDISVLPTTVVVDPDGGVRAAHVGQMSYDQLARAVR